MILKRLEGQGIIRSKGKGNGSNFKLRPKSETITLALFQCNLLRCFLLWKKYCFQIVLPLEKLSIWWWCYLWLIPYLNPWRCYTGWLWGRPRWSAGTGSHWRCTCEFHQGQRRWTSARSHLHSSHLREKCIVNVTVPKRNKAKDKTNMYLVCKVTYTYSHH